MLNSVNHLVYLPDFFHPSTNMHLFIYLDIWDGTIYILEEDSIDFSSSLLIYDEKYIAV